MVRSQRGMAARKRTRSAAGAARDTVLSFLESGGEPVVSARRNFMADELTKACANRLAWEPQPADPDYFVSYAALGGRTAYSAGATQHAVFDTLLSAMRRFYRCVPRRASGTPRAAAGAAVTCSASSPEDARIVEALASTSLRTNAQVLRELVSDVNDEKAFEEGTWTSYRQCQAYWAAKHERFEARVPDKQDAYFMVSARPQR